jgi:hypothetical protein
MELYNIYINFKYLVNNTKYSTATGSKRMRRKREADYIGGDYRRYCASQWL